MTEITRKYIVLIMQCQKAQKQLPNCQKEQKQASCFFCGVLCDVRAYTATVSNRRSSQSGIIKNYILVS